MGLCDLSLLRVGAGGWGYFQVPEEGSLQAYSKAFDFVEVNSTYYDLQSIGTVQAWRRLVPDGFEFSVRCNRMLVDIYCSGNRDEGKRERLLASVEQTCRLLRASVLAVLMNHSGSNAVFGLDSFLSDFRAKGTRTAVEFRGSEASREFLDILEKNDAIHCVDISRGQSPQVESGMMYTRLFGKGNYNVYEFDDNELKQILVNAESPRFEKSVLAFHGVRMYRDAARLKTFAKTGEFPRLTDNTGLDSLQKVLEEDTEFPTTGKELALSQGWKLFDLTLRERARTGDFLQKLPPDRVYTSPKSVRDALEPIMIRVSDH